MTNRRSDRRTLTRVYANWGGFSSPTSNQQGSDNAAPRVQRASPKAALQSSVEVAPLSSFETASSETVVPEPGDHLGWIEPLVDKRVRLTPSRDGEIIGHASARTPARVTAIEGVWFQSTFLSKDGQLRGWITGVDVDYRPVT